MSKYMVGLAAVAALMLGGIGSAQAQFPGCHNGYGYSSNYRGGLYVSPYSNFYSSGYRGNLGYGGYGGYSGYGGYGGYGGYSPYTTLRPSIGFGGGYYGGGFNSYPHHHHHHHHR